MSRVANLRHEPLGSAVYVGRAMPRRGLAGSDFANPPEPCHANVLAELVEADALLDELKAAGVAVEARDGKLRLTPASRVDAALRGRVVALKPAILSLLQANAEPAELWRQAVEVVAESLKLPPDVLAAADRAECEPLRHKPEPAGRDGRGWTRYVCRKCGRFYCYAPDAPAALRPTLERT